MLLNFIRQNGSAIASYRLDMTHLCLRFIGLWFCGSISRLASSCLCSSHQPLGHVGPQGLRLELQHSALNAELIEPCRLGLQEGVLGRMRRYSRQLVHSHPWAPASQVAWGLAWTRVLNLQSRDSYLSGDQGILKSMIRVCLQQQMVTT